MPLFRTHNIGAEIFISLGTGCPTGCQSCYKTLLKNSSLPLSKVKYQIEQGHNVSDAHFSFFLYGNNILKNPYIHEILEYIRSTKRSVKIQIPEYTSLQDIMKFKEIDTTGIFVISKKISSKQELLLIIEALKIFFSQKDIFVNFDLLITQEHREIFEKILSRKACYESDGIYSIDLKNIKITFRELYYINYKSQKVEDLSINSCMVYNSFDMKIDHIEIHDHFEIEPNGDITFHNPLCYIGQPKIANIEMSDDRILKCFDTYKNDHLSKYSLGNMEQNCFSCISNKYHYSNSIAL